MRYKLDYCYYLCVIIRRTLFSPETRLYIVALLDIFKIMLLISSKTFLFNATLTIHFLERKIIADSRETKVNYRVDSLLKHSCKTPIFWVTPLKRVKLRLTTPRDLKG